jgi:hypothetical protein
MADSSPPLSHHDEEQLHKPWGRGKWASAETTDTGQDGTHRA